MIRSRIYSPWRARAILAVALFLLAIPVWAGTLSVSAQFKPKNVGGQLVPTTGTITISDKQYAGMDIKITQEFAGGKKVVITNAGDKVGADGTFKQTSNPATIRPIYIVHIGPANAGDTWVVLSDGTILNRLGRVDTKSFEERKAQQQAQANLGNLGGAPLTVANSFFYTDNLGQQNYILEFSSQSPNTEYVITSLTVYQDLNPMYFTPGSFDSQQAIASGTLAFNTGPLDSEGGLSFVPSLAEGYSMTDIPVLGVQTSGYELVVGQVAPLLSGDGETGTPVLGSPVQFTFAQSAGPMPNPQPSPSPSPNPSPSPQASPSPNPQAMPGSLATGLVFGRPIH